MKINKTKFLAVAMVLLMASASLTALVPTQDTADADPVEVQEASSKLYGMGRNTSSEMGDGSSGAVYEFQQLASLNGSQISVTPKVVISNNNTFYLTSDGNLYGVGDNQYGQLGNNQSGTGSFVYTPTQIDSTLGTITDVVCSNNTIFFLTSDGKLYGMGDNNHGQQGRSSPTVVTTPIQIGSALGTITDVVCSDSKTFFLTSDGKLYGMGQNNYGQQGDGTTIDVKTPTQIGSALGTITDVVCSGSTTFFLTSDGKLYGMGYNGNGQQGDGTTIDVKTPTQIGSALGTITDVVCSGSTTFFLTSDGELYGMGRNLYGQQGGGTTNNVTTPTQIGSALGTITDVVCSDNTTFFLTSDGKLYGMGYNNVGQQGDGTTTNVTTPTQIGSALGTITDVVCSGSTTFFLTSDGKLYGAGQNNHGQIGHKYVPIVSSPIQIGENNENIVKFINHSNFAYYLTSDGKLYGVGNGSYGRMGTGNQSNLITPTQIVATAGTIVDVVCDNEDTYFLTDDGKLYGMGRNQYGQMDTGTTSFVMTPIQIGSTLGTIDSISCSSTTLFFLTSDNKLYGAGYNGQGQQGDGTTTNVTTPTQIGSALGTITDVVCSGNMTFFLTSDGELYGMGRNNYGQQGDGTTNNVTTPTQIGSALGTITDVVCSNNTTFFLTSDGKLYGMGQNNYGQQGDGTTTNVTTPTQIGSALGTITDVVCSNNTTFFLTSDGKLYGMGRNNYGQQGDGTTTNVTTPTQIGSALGTITDVVCSDSTTFFLTSDGKLYGMGSNQYGQIGNGSSGNNAKVTAPNLIGSSLGAITDISCSDETTYFLARSMATITLDVNDSTYGTVSQAQLSVPAGTSISASGSTLTIGTDTITALPSADTVQYDYEFVNWTINDTPISGTVTADSNMTIVANFSRATQTYTVNLATNNANYGSVSPTTIADVPYGSAIAIDGTTNKLTVINTEVTPTPAQSTVYYTYAFSSWSVSNNSAVNETTFPAMVIGQPVTITATFSQTLNTYTLTVQSNNASYGKVSTNSSQVSSLTVDSVPYGATLTTDGNTLIVNKVLQVTVTATPTTDTAHYDYSFDGWSISNNTTVTGDMTITASFSQAVNSYTVTFAKNENAWGSVSESSVTVPYGTTISASSNVVTLGTSPTPTAVTATPTTDTVQYDYGFNNWTNASGTVTGDMTITANFSRTTQNYTLTFQSSNSNWGTVSESSVTAPYGTNITINGNTLSVQKTTPTTVTATPTTDTAQYDYSFVNWSISNNTVVEGDMTVTATFSRAIQVYVATIESNNTTYGTVSQGSIDDIPYNSVIGVNGNELSINGTTVYANTNTATVQFVYAFTGFSVNDGDLITGDTTIIATFTSSVRTYNVSFHVNDSAKGHLVPSSPTVVASEYGSNFTVNGDQISVGGQTYQAVPTTADAQHSYSFVGWYDALTDGNAVTSSTQVLGTMDVYARFTDSVNTYTVTFVTDGSGFGTVSTPSVANVPYGTHIAVNGNTLSVQKTIGVNVTADPNADTAQYDYSFVNWTINDTPIGLSGYTVTGNTTVTANFAREVQQITVDFAVSPAGYGTVQENNVSVASVTVPYGTAITASQNDLIIGTHTVTPVPTTADVANTYGFASWSNATGTVTGTRTITANFTATPNAYTVTVAPNNVGYGSVDITTIPSVPYGTTMTVSGSTLTINTTVPVTITATPAEPTDANTFAFGHWSVANNSTTTDSTSIVAVFEPSVRQYTVTWVIDGTTTTQQYGYGSTPSHSNPTKQYYTFAGWDPTITSVTGNITYTAVFLPTQYTVTWDPTGGYVSPTTTTGNVETAVIVPTPTKQNFTFDGWFTQAEGGDPLPNNFMPNANVTYYAHWTATTYTVYFDATTNGGSTDTDSLVGSIQTPIVLPSATHPVNYFDGWYTDPNAGTRVGFDDDLYYPNASVTLYAHFVEELLYTYSINFIANGGYGMPATVTQSSLEATEMQLTIPASSPYKYGCVFLGWALDQDATTAQYHAGDRINVSADSSVNLYAVWQASDTHDSYSIILAVIPVLMIIGLILGLTAVIFRTRAEGGSIKDLTGMIIGVTVIIIIIAFITVPIISAL